MTVHPGPEKLRASAANAAASDPIWRALQENEDWYQDLVEHSHDLLCVHDLEGRLLSVNPAPARLLGYSVEEMLRIPMREMIAPEFRDQFDPYLKQIQREGEARGLLVVMTRSGERRVWDYRNTLRTEGVESPIVRGMAHDVTGQKRAENLLREASELNRQIIASASEGVAVYDRDLRCVAWNPFMEKITGISAGAALGKLYRELIPPEVKGHDPGTELNRALQGQTVTVPDERISGLDGRQRWVSSCKSPLRDGQGEIAGVIVTLQDITERKRAEDRLQEYERVVEGLEEIIVVLDREYNYVIANRAFLSRRGLTREQVIGHTVGEVLNKAEILNEGVFETIIKPKLDECFQGNVVQFELKYTYPELGERDLSLSYFPIEGPSGIDRVACVLWDITERKRGDEALRQNVDRLQEVTEQLRLAKEKLAEEKDYLAQAFDTELGFGEIIGRSKPLHDVMAKVARVAPSDATVLLLGETGTGKELVARAIHRMSRREKNSFIKMNCAAIPSGLLESELFGHEKGAFTGAVARKLGRLELADKGTLFLDEIGDIPLSLQPKLLRVLQDMEFERLGGTQTLKVDFRLLAATNRDLLQGVRAREFRNDLYYRLNVFPIHLPPLRDRREDIRPLVEHFVRKFAAQMKKSITSIPSKTMEALVRWEWPGNIRELENFLERSVILTPGTVLQSPLSEMQNVINGDHEGRTVTLRDKERARILEALRECHGKLGGPDGAAARLGLKRTTLQSKLDQLGIKPGSYRK
jgi:formate hydrogenlyase transcriptional activator